MRTRASVASKASRHFVFEIRHRQKKWPGKGPAILISGGQASGIHRFEEFAVVLRVAQLV
jgi:hypothetical protein